MIEALRKVALRLENTNCFCSGTVVRRRLFLWSGGKKSHLTHGKQLVSGVLLFLGSLGTNFESDFFFFYIFVAFSSVLSNTSATMRRTVLKLQLICMFCFIHEPIAEFFHIYKVVMTNWQSD